MLRKKLSAWATGTSESNNLLLGLMREKGCEAARALMESGLTLRKARAVATEVNQAAVHATVGAAPGRPPRISLLELVDDATGERLDVRPLHPLMPLPRIGEQVRAGSHRPRTVFPLGSHRRRHLRVPWPSVGEDPTSSEACPAAVETSLAEM